MIRTGIGYDIHRFVAGRDLVLGGVVVPFDQGLEGHSDADVVSHAVADAVLGAVGDGDIGTHFPDTDQKWKDACSLDLLSHIASMISSNATINNVDVTVLAEKPKLAGYREEMCANIARALSIEADQVSVKATTLEGIGELGHGVGMAAMAVATVDQVRRGD